MRVSVIVPVYNTADFVAECIESLLSQTYTDFELILVNDGSTDDSLAVISRYTSDARVVILDRANGGVSQARNAGLDAARGEIMVFVDSDDTVSRDYLADLVAGIDAGAEMVMAAVDIVGNGAVPLRFVGLTEGAIYDGTNLRADSAQIFQGEGAIMHSSPCNKAFLKRLITSSRLRFVEGLRYGEDHYFNLQYYLLAGRYRLINKSNYHYRARLDSACHTFDEGRIAQHARELQLKREILYQEYAHASYIYGRIAVGIAFTLLSLVAKSELSLREKYHYGRAAVAMVRRELVGDERVDGTKEKLVLELLRRNLTNTLVTLFILRYSI